MVRLKEIKRENNIISASCEAVDMHNHIFVLYVDINTREIVKNSWNEMNSCVAMARNHLLDLVDEYGKKVPKESTCMWY